MAYRPITAKYEKFFNQIAYAQPTQIEISLDKNDFDLEALHPAILGSFELDENGDFIDTNGVIDGKISLWCNAGGNTGSKYKVKEPDGFIWFFVLDYGDGTAISLMQLRAESVPPGTPIPTISSLADERIAASAVRYDVEQDLTDEQKLQARTNIDAGTGSGGGAANTTNYAAALSGSTVAVTGAQTNKDNLIGGNRIFDGNSWQSANGAAILIDFNTPRLVSRVDIYAVTTTNDTAPTAVNPTYTVTSANIDARIGNSWQRVGSFSENEGTYISAIVKNVQVLQIRIANILGGDGTVRVAEIEIY